MRRRILGQHGQAMVEALLLLPILILMLLAIAWVGKTQYSALTLLQDSRAAAMLIAMGAGAEAHDVPRGVLLQLVAGAGDEEGQGEWSAADARRVSAMSSADVSGGAGWGDVRLVRRIAVAAGAGNARDDDEVQRRIGAAMTMRNRAAANSVSLARVVAPVIEAVDAPWHRSSLSLDWLSSWADVVPADKRMNDDKRGHP
ncbi:TadE/TadG family type IV pilus assembly protein [Achromobacter ruhlandii]|uniref:TadE/TadG family type IV pilus assembly protein n=1 Tax=Achromobacter ruhlandii TaxID=72557 RepID=UPI001EED516B|nr:TadE/TadG family type IV pilus assembly protein [Achromobacter ruhlandii]MCZ8398077.1 TadE/TadG family type IV pilus assembly protein [Achromobacter ruhlandii]